MTMQQYCLRWNNHQPNFISVFSSLLNNESLVDVTLAAEGRHLQAHKVVLSACSSYFQSLFTINPCQHPIVILKDVKFSDLKVMVDFMYYGEVNVSQEQLPHILKTAEMLKIKGLAEIPVDQSALTKSHNSSADRAELLTPGDSNWSSDDVHRHSLSPSPCPLSPASKRKRLRKTSTGSGSAERTSEDHTAGEVTLTSPGGSTLATVIKPDPGSFTSENSTPVRSKQHSTDSEPQRGSSHDSGDCDPPLQITLQVPQQDTSHNLETQAPLDIAGPSAIPQQTNSDIVVKTEKVTEDLLPVKSRSSYDKEHNIFLNWKSSNSVKLVNETVMLEYFQNLAKKYSPNTLWTKYSILKSSLIVNDNINISVYPRLVSFLKQKSKGYVPKKSKVLTGDQVVKFIKDAPNESYLMHKVVLIMGAFGALKGHEMVRMTVDDIEDKGSHILVKIPKINTNEVKRFAIVDEGRVKPLKYIRQYAALRPPKMEGCRFFLTYKNNRCTVQPVGKNTIGGVASIIAKFLKLDNPKEYTGHCLRRIHLR
ncbi:hypothetical protein FQR65_LT07347 [Abscondita terminalis]|nr:hypothetical protein FQR65_LT07347 [Abscondita terminalis]